MLTSRKIKRWFRRWRAWRAVLPQLETEYRPVLEQAFDGPVTWQSAGGRGCDVICLIRQNGHPVGYLRMADPLAMPSTPLEAGMPFVSLSAEEKITREWLAYERGAAHSLTPRPLWRDEHAMLSSYIDAHTLADEATHGASRLEWAIKALPAIARLHTAGITHMDMSLPNILRMTCAGGLVFVDFEYGPAPSLTFEQQCLYDYLRILESVWKFLSPKEQKDAAIVWRNAFMRHAPEAVRTAELAPLKPALGRILPMLETSSLFPHPR